MNGGPFNVSIRTLKGVRPLTGETPGSYSAPAAFGRFQVLHQIGAGVLGPVFLARDPDRHSVAIKVFRLDITPEQAAELASQLNVLARANLSHPAIVAPASAAVEGTVAYLVEDYVGADSLDAAIRQYGPAPAAQAIRILASVAGALDFAAAVNVHHGALHMRDVLVSPEEVRLTGLGVGRALEAIGLRAPIRRPYTAPERAQREAWDARADVYSLGVLARDLLVPRVKGGEQEAEGRIPDEQAALLVPILTRATSPRPSDRFSGALDLVSAIQAALAGRSTSAARPKAEPRAAARANELMLPLDDSHEAQPGPRSEVSTPAENEPDAGVRSEVARPEPQEIEPAEASAADLDAFRVSEASMGQPPADAGDLRLDTGNGEQAREPLIDVVTLDTKATVDGSEAGVPRHEGIVPEPPPDQAEPPRFTDVVESPAEPARAEPPPPAERLRGPRRPPLGLRSRPESARLRMPRAPEPERATPAIDDRMEPVSSRLGEGSGKPGGGDVEHDATAPYEVPTVPIAVPEAPLSPRLPTLFGDTTPPEREPSRAVPLILVLLVGLVLGAVGGYYFGASRSTTPPAQQPAASPPVSAAPAPAAATPARPTGEVPQASAAKQALPAGPVRPQPSAPARVLPAPTPAAPAPAPASGRLTVNSTPRGALVVVNGKRRGVTPLRIPNLPPGRYTVRVSRSGYTTEERQVSLTAERPASTVAVTLSKAAAERASRNGFYGSLSVESSPPGAKIFLDGRGVGTTPAVIEKVAVGSHVVRVDMIGFRRWARSVQVTSGERIRVTASLERESQ